MHTDLSVRGGKLAASDLARVVRTHVLTHLGDRYVKQTIIVPYSPATFTSVNAQT